MTDQTGAGESHMSVSIEPVTSNNRKACLALSLWSHQEGFIPDVASALAMAVDYPDTQPLAVTTEAGRVVGFGLYGLEARESNETLIGAGLNIGLGLDFFFARHVGVGAELSYKKIDYFSKSLHTESGELIRDLDPNLNGDTIGFMLTLTIQ